MTGPQLNFKRIVATAAATLLLSSGIAIAQTTLTIESWRNDDADLWTNTIIPAFEKDHPDIKVVFNPMAPTEYNAALNSRLEGGSAGDLITCRPFDASLDLFKKGYLASVNDLPGMENFSDVAKVAWQTDDGADHLLRADGFGHPRLHLQQGHLRRAQAHRAEDRRRVLQGARRDQGRRQLRAARHRHRRSVGSRHHGLPEHRPELLEAARTAARR